MLRLILHAGTPKTGTTSLQMYLDRQREALLRKGILYPCADTARYGKPKHQWIVDALMAPESDHFMREMERVVAGIEPDIDTLILSTEGLFHHWWDFSAAGRDALASLAVTFDVSLWVWFREPISFVRSNYIQMLKNPRGYVPCYGRNLSVEEMLDDPWFARHLDYIGFVRDVERVLGNGRVVPFAYQGNTIAAFLDALGVQDIKRETLNEYRTPGRFGTHLLHTLNRYNLAENVRRQSITVINRLDALMGPISPPLRLAPTTERRIQGLACASVRALERDFGLSLQSPAADGGPV